LRFNCKKKYKKSENVNTYISYLSLRKKIKKFWEYTYISLSLNPQIAVGNKLTIMKCFVNDNVTTAACAVFR